MKRFITAISALLAAAALSVGLPAAALAQTAKVLSSCGTAGYSAGTFNYTTQDTTGAQCSGATTGYGGVLTVSLTRPANTTTYTANTGLSTSTSSATFLTFTNICRANGTAVLVPQIVVGDGANQTTKLSGAVQFFNVPPASPIADNAAWAIASSDIANATGPQIAFTASNVTNTTSGASGSTQAAVAGTTYQLTCAAGSRNLYAMLQVTNAYVPVSAEAYTVTVSYVGVN